MHRPCMISGSADNQRLLKAHGHRHPSLMRTMTLSLVLCPKPVAVVLEVLAFPTMVRSPTQQCETFRTATILPTCTTWKETVGAIARTLTARGATSIGEALPAQIALTTHSLDPSTRMKTIVPDTAAAGTTAGATILAATDQELDTIDDSLSRLYDFLYAQDYVEYPIA